MGAIRDQFQLSRFWLQHDSASDFYLSCWQCNRRPLPLLCVRLVLFLGCIALLLTSMLLPGRITYIAYWPIYMAQWGLLMITLTYGLATVVSAVAYIKGPIDATFGLPWYIRLFWGCYCISVPVAFHNTIFYYSFIRDEYHANYEMNAVLDVFTNGVSSAVMFLILITSNHSVYFVQFLYPLLFMIVYLIFTIIYYSAGGTSPFGDRWIYPILDWSEAGSTAGVVCLSVAILVSVYIVAVFLTLLRNQISRRIRRTTLYITG